MTSIDPARLALDPTHCRAICEEIGERLRPMLAVAPELPPHLRRLLARFDEWDRVAALSIVPSFEEPGMSTALTNEGAMVTS